MCGEVTCNDGRGCSGRGACLFAIGSVEPTCLCDDGWDGNDCKTSIGLETLVYGLGIGGGTVAALLVLGTVVWFVRLLGSDSVTSPITFLMHSRWKGAHTHVVDFGLQAPVRQATGYRSRVTPTGPPFC